MNDKNISRRKFIASTSALMAAGALPGIASGAEEPGSEKLALDGGPKSVKRSAPKLVRFGEPERERLNAMIGQSSLLYWKGPQTAALIDRFRQHYPRKYVMTCSSGTAAVHIAVASAGIGPGDEVITTPVTDMGTVIGVLFQQAVPVFADLDPHDYNLDVKDVERKITAKTKAIIAVHLWGNPSRLNELKALADKRGLVLIEDCAQAWGAQYQGQAVGTIGHIACFSLQDSKQITCGEGGIVASNDERFGPLLQRFGDKGIDRTNVHVDPGVLATNYRMSEPQAAVAAAQMDRMKDLTTKRAKLGALLTEQIKDTKGIAVHRVAAQDQCTFYSYMMRFEPDKMKCDRGQFVKALNAEGVGANAGYIPEPLYRKVVFQKHAFFAGRWPTKEMGLTTMDYTGVNCPEAEAILKTCVTTKITEAMDEEYVRDLATGIRKVAKHYAA